MTSSPRVLYLATTAMPRIPGTDAVFQDIDALREETRGEMLNLYPLPFATRFYPPFLLGLHAVGRLRRLAENADLLHIYALADRLHKSVGEVLQMPASELSGWSAYIGLMKQRREED